MPQLGTVETHVAKKRYRCWWCGEPIEPGEKYVRWAWTDEGKIETTRVHPECDVAWGTLHYEDAELVSFGSCCRGCTCETGNCECGKEQR